MSSVDRPDPRGRRARQRPTRSESEPRRRGRRSNSRLLSFLRATFSNGRLPAFLLSVGLIVLLFGFLSSSDFDVRSVVVQGNTLAYADAIVSASGALGQPIFRLNTEEVARRVAAYPAVASAEVSARFPDRVVVQLHERVPVLVWQVGNDAVLVDAQGWVIAPGYEAKLPRVLQQSGKLPAAGTQLPDDLIQASAAITKRLGARLSALDYDPQVGLTAHLSDSRTIVFGSSDQMPLKLNVVDAVLSSIHDPWTKLDVREPERPYYQ